nr:hypothetical protein [Tanacetum cinerariifolium]
QHVKQQNTQRNSIDSARNHALRIARFTGGDANDFDAAEGKHDHRQRRHEAADAIGHEAALGPQIAHMADGFARRRTDAEQHDAEAGQDHRDDGADLEQRQPEFEFAKDFDAAQVERADQE